MPTYSYECGKCGHQFDVFHGMSESPALKCEVCGSKKVGRLIGTGAGLIFKGGGFYETDYKAKKGEAPKESKAEKKEPCGSGCACAAKSGAGQGAKKAAPAATES